MRRRSRVLRSLEDGNGKCLVVASEDDSAGVAGLDSFRVSSNLSASSLKQTQPVKTARQKSHIDYVGQMCISISNFSLSFQNERFY